MLYRLVSPVVWILSLDVIAGLQNHAARKAAEGIAGFRQLIGGGCDRLTVIQSQHLGGAIGYDPAV
jgi:hypothetical protein